MAIIESMHRNKPNITYLLIPLWHFACWFSVIYLINVVKRLARVIYTIIICCSYRAGDICSIMSQGVTSLRESNTESFQRCITWFPLTVLQLIRLTDVLQTSDISRTLVGNRIIDHSDVVGAAPVVAVHQRCSNNIFILDLTTGLNRWRKDNYMTRRYTFKLCDSDIKTEINEIWSK